MALGIALAALALLATLLVPPASAVTQARYDRQAIHATNARRADHGLHLLRRNRCLQRFAAMQAHRMAARHMIFHQDLHAPLRRCHLSWAGENVAQGFPTGWAVVNIGWMRSREHRANILSRHYRLIGLAAVRSHGVWYVSQVFGRH